MASIPTTEPGSVAAGDTIAWRKVLADYPPSSGWGLSYVLLSPTAKIELSASADGEAHRISVAASASANWSPGAYLFTAYVTKSGERYTVGQGRITVTPNMLNLSTLDGRSQARKMLEALEKAYQDYLAAGQGHVAEYEIAGRRMRFRSSAEIIEQMDRLRREVAQEERAERIAAGLPSRRRVLVRFGGNG